LYFLSLNTRTHHSLTFPICTIYIFLPQVIFSYLLTCVYVLQVFSETYIFYLPLPHCFSS
jgi:hypothetical protein